MDLSQWLMGRTPSSGTLPSIGLTLLLPSPPLPPSLLNRQSLLTKAEDCGEEGSVFVMGEGAEIHVKCHPRRAKMTLMAKAEAHAAVKMGHRKWCEVNCVGSVSANREERCGSCTEPAFPGYMARRAQTETSHWGISIPPASAIKVPAPEAAASSQRQLATQDSAKTTADVATARATRFAAPASSELAKAMDYFAPEAGAGVKASVQSLASSAAARGGGDEVLRLVGAHGRESAEKSRVRQDVARLARDEAALTRSRVERDMERASKRASSTLDAQSATPSSRFERHVPDMAYLPPRRGHPLRFAPRRLGLRRGRRGPEAHSLASVPKGGGCHDIMSCLSWMFGASEPSTPEGLDSRVPVGDAAYAAAREDRGGLRWRGVNVGGWARSANGAGLSEALDMGGALADQKVVYPRGARAEALSQAPQAIEGARGGGNADEHVLQRAAGS